MLEPKYRSAFSVAASRCRPSFCNASAFDVVAVVDPDFAIPESSVERSAIGDLLSSLCSFYYTSCSLGNPLKYIAQLWWFDDGKGNISCQKAKGYPV